MITKGQKINDRYQIIKNIGEGGMANVYLAEDTILNRKVAVKVLRGDLSDDDKFVRRFQREALSASSLSHFNIVEMYDVGEDDGKYYIVMEYVEGKTLKQLVKKRGALALTEVVDIMLQLTSAMAHAHESYIIHRDIKPQNILIMEDGCVKITDFGIAMAMNGTQLTQTNSVMGSVHYLPPEQANGNGATIKSDIYSLGILMYELVIGKIPFKGENAVEIALKHLKDEVPSVRKQNSNIPQSIENVIIKATAKNPQNRYADATEMQEDLKTVLEDSRKNEKKYVYEHEEQDLEATKRLAIINGSNFKNSGKDSKLSKPIKEKKINKFLLVMGIVLSALIMAIVGFFIVLPALTKVAEIKIPDVSGLTIQEAEEVLKDAGFEVEDDVEEVTSDDIDLGLVVKTEPAIGRIRREGTSITLFESSGTEVIVLEDYIGQNSIEVKAVLEKMYELHVIVEKEEVEDSEDDPIENEIIRQDPVNGTKLTAGDTVTLYIADIVFEYPDIVAEGWSVSDVEAFVEEYGLILTKEYIDSIEEAPGTIIYQSRTEGTTIIEGTTLKIKITQEPVVEEPEEEEEPEPE